MTVHLQAETSLTQ